MPEKYRLLEGAPPDDELFIRLTVTKTFKPNLLDAHYYKAQPQVEIDTPKTVLDAMLYDIYEIDSGIADYHELLFPVGDPDDDKTDGIWEIVDAHGTVWSEEVEQDEQEEESN